MKDALLWCTSCSISETLHCDPWSWACLTTGPPFPHRGWLGPAQAPSQCAHLGFEPWCWEEGSSKFMLRAFFGALRISRPIFCENCFKCLQYMAKSRAWRKSRGVLRQGLTFPGRAGCQAGSCQRRLKHKDEVRCPRSSAGCCQSHGRCQLEADRVEFFCPELAVGNSGVGVAGDLANPGH